MSLFGQTARFLLLTALLIALIGSVGFYTLIHRKIRHEVDEILMSQVEQAKQRITQHPQTSFVDTGDDNPHITPTNQLTPPVFSDEIIADSTIPGKPLETRQLLATVQAQGQLYRVRVRQPYYEFNELARDLSIGVIVGFLALMGLSVAIGLGLAERLWKPFYRIITGLSQFRLDQPDNAVFPPARISEFALLSNSLTELTGKLRQQFSLQKQFTENASHELQTPLAIASAELDFLRQSQQLIQTDHAHLERATDALSRLSQLNRSLLLLTQVENNQFSTDENLNLSDLLHRYILDFEPFFTHKNLNRHITILPKVYLWMNRQLAGVLLTNLLKNAARHCSTDGQLRIDLSMSSLSISNTGNPLPFDQRQLFLRFVKDPARPESTGLGLALVHQICDRYQLPLTYQYDAEHREHTFQIKLMRTTTDNFKIAP